ncbi:MAG TPA: hypothetical protein VN841_20200 [Bryobacteraceae bacterium]|nr:hypothetical protein [Bryobacteraceae bacterium]
MHPNTTTTKRAVALALALTLTAAITLAHEGFEHVMGTVTKVTVQSVTVATTGNKTVDVAINDKTTYARGTQKVAAADLKVGDRVVIDATGEAPKLVAASVKIGATAAAAATHDEHTHK